MSMIKLQTLCTHFIWVLDLAICTSDVSGLLVDAKYIYENVSKKKFEKFKEKIKRIK